MTSAKYAFTGQVGEENGRPLRQIYALRDLELSGVRAGDVGGWIEHEGNLAHDGQCWVYPQARVMQQARVTGDCRIADRALVDGAARLSDFVLMHHDSRVTDEAVLEGVISLSGDAMIYGGAHLLCSEDGPHLMPGVQLDFDVAYHLPYMVFSASYSGELVAVSSAGRICLAGHYDHPRWGGTLEEFRQWVNQHRTGTPDVLQVVRQVELYLTTAKVP